MEAMVVVSVLVVGLEVRQFANDPDVVEAGLLSELTKEPGLQLFARIKPSGGNLNAHVRVLRILEDEELVASLGVASHVRDDALAKRHPRCARIFALCSRFAAW